MTTFLACTITGYLCMWLGWWARSQREKELAAKQAKDELVNSLTDDQMRTVCKIMIDHLADRPPNAKCPRG